MTTDVQPPDEAKPAEASTGGSREPTRLEIFEAVLLAVAALLTAWAAFQSTKWGGVQANSFNRAGAVRTESVRISGLADRQTIIDVDSFSSWINAVANEQRNGIENGLADDGTYVPVPSTQSGFLHDRFRDEFREAFDVWVAGAPLTDAQQYRTPFELPEYRLAADVQAQRLERQADALAAKARQANQRGDNYVMMTIVFALALVLIGVGSKMRSDRVRVALAAGSATALVMGVVAILTYPVSV